jgi:hypothetical protein
MAFIYFKETCGELIKEYYRINNKNAKKNSFNLRNMRRRSLIEIPESSTKKV